VHKLKDSECIFLYVFQVSRIFVNPSFNASNFQADVAMLVLASTVQYTTNVRPVCLWNQRDISLESIIGKEGVVRSSFQIEYVFLKCAKVIMIILLQIIAF
jgi:hypothetical protein